MASYYVYIMASRRNGTIYIGVTNDLPRRAYEHREALVKGFTKRYAVKKLVYFEEFQDIGLAIAREKRLKEWQRQWKIDLINGFNPKWNDLAGGLN